MVAPANVTGDLTEQQRSVVVNLARLVFPSAEARVELTRRDGGWWLASLVDCTNLSIGYGRGPSAEAALATLIEGLAKRHCQNCINKGVMRH